MARWSSRSMLLSTCVLMALQTAGAAFAASQKTLLCPAAGSNRGLPRVRRQPDRFCNENRLRAQPGAGMSAAERRYSEHSTERGG